MTRHEGRVAISSIRRPQPDTEPQPVNEHPGPDLPGKATT